MLFRTLLVSHDKSLRARVRPILADSGVMVSELSSADGIWELLGSASHDLLVVDLDSMPDGVESAISETRILADRPELIVLSTTEDPELRAGLLAAGCLAIVSHDLADGSLKDALTTLIDRQQRAAADQVQADQELKRSALSDFAASSQAMRHLLHLTRKVVPTDTSLLVLGETGVGKEWLARAIHAEGPRAARPFIALNCAAIPETLLESELFGHERGAFTGATRARRGLFELAHRGTLFLDEIGDLQPHLQAKILRALQDREITRLGSEATIPVDVRIIAATNQDLQEAIGEKRFREDLYYRLSVMVLVVPPLRERVEDIPALVETYFDQFREQLGRADIHGISRECLRALCSHTWPGNVRELINVLERAVLLCEGDVLMLDDLPETIVAAAAPLEETPAASGHSLVFDLDAWLDVPLPEARRHFLERLERTYLRRLLHRTNGQVTQTARLAGIDPRTLYNKMRQYGIRKEQYRSTNDSVLADHRPEVDDPGAVRGLE